MRAGALMREALAIQERVYGAVHPRVASALNELGNVQVRQGRLDEAEATFKRLVAVYREVYHDKHYYIGVALSNLAGVYQQREQYATAESLFREVLRRYADTLPSDHQLVGIARIRLGRQIVLQKRYAEASPRESGRLRHPDEAANCSRALAADGTRGSRRRVRWTRSTRSRAAVPRRARQSNDALTPITRSQDSPNGPLRDTANSAYSVLRRCSSKTLRV
jgi:tetratricopeptide (TPR) repeat protein